MSGASIDACGLELRHGAVTAVAGLDLQVAAGEFVALLGPNGAGKSSTLSMLTTLRRPDAGSACVGGFDVVRDRAQVRRRIGIVFQDPTLDVHLTVDENLRFHATLHGIRRRDASRRIEPLLESFGLGDRRSSLVRTLSGGLRRRVEVARALLHEPQVLFLDEPTVGLDPRARQVLADEVDAARRERGTTTVLCTHHLAEAERCDRVAIIDRGELVAFDTPAALLASVPGASTLDEVFLARTGRALADEAPSRRDEGRLADRQRSGQHT